MSDSELVYRETDDAWATLSPAELDHLTSIDMRRLNHERSRVAPTIAQRMVEPTYSARNRFRYWERMIYKMEHGWPPDGVYFIEEYMNDLTNRDSIHELMEELDLLGVSSRLHDLVEKLDNRFLGITLFDGGALLKAVKPVAFGDLDRNWWWLRRPQDVPW